LGTYFFLALTDLRRKEQTQVTFFFEVNRRGTPLLEFIEKKGNTRILNTTETRKKRKKRKEEKSREEK